jgi:hypothetical protein
VTCLISEAFPFQVGGEGKIPSTWITNLISKMKWRVQGSRGVVDEICLPKNGEDIEIEVNMKNAEETDQKCGESNLAS